MREQKAQPVHAAESTPHEHLASDQDFELAVAGFQGTPEEIERQWFERVYTGRVLVSRGVRNRRRRDDHGRGADLLENAPQAGQFLGPFWLWLKTVLGAS